MATLDIRGLTVKYGSVTAVDDLSVSVADGEFVTLLGPSGCGKTTTLRAIAGLERCTGELKIDGRTIVGRGVSVPPEDRGVNMVFQSYAIWPHMSVFKNVAFGLRTRGVRRAEVRTRVDAALKMVGLANFSERNATELSGGQQQRVALARAVVTEPTVLLFDEPLSNLDAALRDEMRDEIRALHERIGMTCVYVTHDQSEAIVMSDRIVLMDGGRIVQQGDPRELYRTPVNQFAANFLGVENLVPGQLVPSDGSVFEHHISHDAADSNNGIVRWRVAIPELGNQAELGEGVLGIRAECLRVRPDSDGVGPSVNCWPGTVRRVSYLGGYFSLDVQLVDGPVVSCQISSGTSFSVGDDVMVEASGDDFIWLPADRSRELVGAGTALTAEPASRAAE